MIDRNADRKDGASPTDGVESSLDTDGDVLFQYSAWSLPVMTSRDMSRDVGVLTRRRSRRYVQYCIYVTQQWTYICSSTQTLLRVVMLSTHGEPTLLCVVMFSTHGFQLTGSSRLKKASRILCCVCRNAPCAGVAGYRFLVPPVARAHFPG